MTRRLARGPPRRPRSRSIDRRRSVSRPARRASRASASRQIFASRRCRARRRLSSRDRGRTRLLRGCFAASAAAHLESAFAGRLSGSPLAGASLAGNDSRTDSSMRWLSVRRPAPSSRSASNQCSCRAAVGLAALFPKRVREVAHRLWVRLPIHFLVPPVERANKCTSYATGALVVLQQQALELGEVEWFHEMMIDAAVGRLGTRLAAPP